MKQISVYRLHTFWYRVIVAVFFIGLLLVWLLLKPGSHSLFLAGDMLAQPLSIIIGMIISFHGGSWRLPMSRVALNNVIRTPRFWMPIVFFLICIDQFIAQVITAYMTFTTFMSTSMVTPGATWADVFFLTSYPLLIVFFCLQPTHPHASLGRVRIVLDSLIIMVTAIVFSWYFILGPMLLQSQLDLATRILASAYPVSDLMLIFYLLQLIFRTIDVRLRPGISLLAAAILILVFLDCSIEYKVLNNGYYLGTLLDISLPIVYLCFGLAFYALRIAQREQLNLSPAQQLVEVSPKQVSILPSFWLSSLLYTLILIVLGLTCYVLLQGRVDPLAWGVYTGSLITIVLVLVRQITLIRAVTNYASMTTALNEELHNANNRLETQATTDPLTGLLNHRALLTILTHEVERAHRYQHPCTLLFMDLDHFKALNDGYGHAAGDEVLFAFGQRLHQSVRGIDTVGRWGGEEFIAILPETTMKEAQVIAERICSIVGQQSFAIGGGLYLTCSIGIASSPTHATDLNALINAADQAMYAAKRLGRNQYRSIDDLAVQTMLAGEEGEGDREGTALQGFVDALVTLLASRKASLGSHSYEVADLVNRLALQLGVPTLEGRMMHLAGQLHAIGKVGVPDAILYKPLPLTQKEWQQMRKHPQVGAEILTHIPALRPLAPVIRAQYEHWDGTGYPDQLQVDDIPLAARVIAVADAYLTLTRECPNQEARSSEVALMELQDAAGTQFDPMVVDALSTLLPGQHQQPYLHLVG